MNDNNGDTSEQTVTVTIIGDNDDPVVSAADFTGGVTELVIASGNLTDTGTLTASVSIDSMGTGRGGEITWNYFVAASSVEYLAKDQTKVETFSFHVLDDNGCSIERTVTATITGTNDNGLLSDINSTITGTSADDIISGFADASGNNGITSVGTIPVVDGNDIITGSAVAGGKGIYNNGYIYGGNGSGTVDALTGGFGGNGAIDLGNDDDILKGFGSGTFVGGDGAGTLVFGAIHRVLFNRSWDNHRLDSHEFIIA